MKTMKEILEKIKGALIGMNIAESAQLVKQALAKGVPAQDILDKGMIAGLKVVGEKFRRDEIFLPEVMLSANAFKACFEILKPILLSGNYTPRAKIILGTVAGDVHDIGKNIVSALLEGNGYQVIDLGVNVSAQKFLEAIQQQRAPILGMSTLLTTTMPEMEKVIKALIEAGIRDKVKVIIGGAAVSREYAEKIGADGYGEDAQNGVDLINQWVGVRS